MQTILEENSTVGYRADVTNLAASSPSAVSWGAIFAGAAAAAGLSLILLILGAGLGFATTSPWSGEGISAKTFGISTIIWVIFMAFAASAVGGYIAGRLRTKWVGVHTNEVYFRDTAHGFLAWSVATLATAAFLSSVTGAIVTGGVKAGTSVISGVASTASATAGQMEDNVNGGQLQETLRYFVDSLFRNEGTRNQTTTPPPGEMNAPADPNTPDTTTGDATINAPEGEGAVADTAPRQTPSTAADPAQQNTAEVSAEVARIFINALREEGPLPQEDVRYIGQLIAERTDISQEEAEQRVNDIYTRIQTNLGDAETAAKEAADKAREASAYASLWFFVSLLIGAFAASLAATFGGRQRDL